LRMWQKGIEIVKDIYMLTSKFPKEEIYGLTAQMRRSAISIPSNIAEGFKRSFPKEYKQFLHISLGSAAELETQPLSFAKVMEHYPFYCIPLTLPSPPTTGERIKVRGSNVIAIFVPLFT